MNLSLVGYRTLKGLCTLTPPRLAAIFLPAIARLVWCVHGTGRLRVVRNLAALGRISGADFSGLGPEVYRHFACFFYEFFSARPGWIAWNMETLRESLLERFGQPGEGQKAGLLLVAHLGNWEIGLRAMLSYGYRVSTVVMSHGSKEVDELFGSLRANPNLEQYQVEDGLRPCLRALKEGRVLILACERDYSGGGRELELNGCRFSFPVGAAYLRMKTGTPITLACPARTGLGVFDITLENMTETPESGNADGIEVLSRSIASRIFGIICRHPGQWITFHDYFRVATK